jgi:hypothetical protein
MLNWSPDINHIYRYKIDNVIDIPFIITSIPVGGYSFSIKEYSAMPSSLYLFTVAILTTTFTMVKRKIYRRTKRL